MPWAQTPATTASIRAFLSDAASKWRSREEFGYIMRHGTTNDVVGGCGLHPRQGPGVLEIGYWVQSRTPGTESPRPSRAHARTRRSPSPRSNASRSGATWRTVPSAAVPKRLGSSVRPDGAPYTTGARRDRRAHDLGRANAVKPSPRVGVRPRGGGACAVRRRGSGGRRGRGGGRRRRVRGRAWRRCCRCASRRRRR